MRVLVVTSTFPRWEKDNEPPFVFELCRGMSCEFDIQVLAPHAPKTKVRETMDGLNIFRYRYCFEMAELLAYGGGIMANLKSARWRLLLVPFFLTTQFIALLRILKRYKPDAIHAHWLIPQGLVAVTATCFLRHPPALICTSHGTDLHGLRGILFSAIRRMVVRRASLLTVTNPAMKAICSGLTDQPDKIHVVPMGVDTSTKFQPSNDVLRKDKDLLFVGRLVPGKGLEVLIRAMPLILERHPDATLTIVGKGAGESTCRSMAAESGLMPRLRFLDALPNEALPELYQSASMLIFPSTSEEGFGLVCVEALACECPVIAADWPSTRGIITHGETGYLVEPGNVSALAEKILLLLDAPECRHNFGKAGRDSVIRRYDWSVISSSYTDLINKAIAQTNR